MNIMPNSLLIDLIALTKPRVNFLIIFTAIVGMLLAQDYTLDYSLMIYASIGIYLAASAAAVINHVVDQKIDAIMDRTKSRPIASGKISITLGLIYVSILCLTAFLILIQFNLTTILLGLASMPFAFSYPLMKRYTYWPQLFLGFTFNYGIIMAWFSINSQFSYIPIIFYFGAIFWTLAYDTIYGFQDIKDDEIIGVKSTSIKFKTNPKLFIFVCYLIFIFFQIITGVLMEFNYYYFIGIIIIACHLLIFQTLKLNISNTNICLKTFKSNNFLGLLVFINILINKI